MQQGILVFGANGCGKLTAGRKLAEKLGMRFLDAEDYAFVDSAVPFAKARPREEYTALVQQEILKGDDFVLAAVKATLVWKQSAAIPVRFIWRPTAQPR